MKGPGLRTKLNVRREWRCPQTGKSLWLSGRQTQVLSPFARGDCFMELIEHQIPPRVQPPLEEILAHMVIEAEPRPPEPETTEPVAEIESAVAPAELPTDDTTPDLEPPEPQTEST